MEQICRRFARVFRHKSHHISLQISCCLCQNFLKSELLAQTGQRSWHVAETSCWSHEKKSFSLVIISRHSHTANGSLLLVPLQTIPQSFCPQYIRNHSINIIWHVSKKVERLPFDYFLMAHFTARSEDRGRRRRRKVPNFDFVLRCTSVSTIGIFGNFKISLSMREASRSLPILEFRCPVTWRESFTCSLMSWTI